METTDLEVVPLTEREKIDIAEAWLGYLHAVPPDADPDLRARNGGGVFTQIVNQILAAHDFEPFTASFSWDDDNVMVLLARPLPSTRQAQ